MSVTSHEPLSPNGSCKEAICACTRIHWFEASHHLDNQHPTSTSIAVCQKTFQSRPQQSLHPQLYSKCLTNEFQSLSFVPLSRLNGGHVQVKKKFLLQRSHLLSVEVNPIVTESNPMASMWQEEIEGMALLNVSL